MAGLSDFLATLWGGGGDTQEKIGGPWYAPQSQQTAAPQPATTPAPTVIPQQTPQQAAPQQTMAKKDDVQPIDITQGGIPDSGADTFPPPDTSPSDGTGNLTNIDITQGGKPDAGVDTFPGSDTTPPPKDTGSWTDGWSKGVIPALITSGATAIGNAGANATSRANQESQNQFTAEQNRIQWAQQLMEFQQQQAQAAAIAQAQVGMANAQIKAAALENLAKTYLGGSQNSSSAIQGWSNAINRAYGK